MGTGKAHEAPGARSVDGRRRRDANVSCANSREPPVQPLNIKRLVSTNERYAGAEVYDTDVRKTNIICTWHEKQYQKSRTRNVEVNVAEGVDLTKSIHDERSE